MSRFDRVEAKNTDMALITALAGGMTVAAAARQTGVSERTIWRKLQTDRGARRSHEERPEEARTMGLEDRVRRLEASLPPETCPECGDWTIELIDVEWGEKAPPMRTCSTCHGRTHAGRVMRMVHYAPGPNGEP